MMPNGRHPLMDAKRPKKEHKVHWVNGQDGKVAMSLQEAYDEFVARGGTRGL